jgi:uncharacterized caspase-like protein
MPAKLCLQLVGIVISILIVATPISSSEAGERVALVIGNSAYRYTTPLANPVNDAEDMAAALSGLGFQVTKRVDLDKAGMDRALQEFAVALKGARLGVFLYAGHGLQVSGQNHLVPVDAKLESPSGLDFETVRLDVVQRLMENESETNLLFLDACRDNPLLRNLRRSMGARSSAVGSGLAAQEAGSGTLISFSTQPGNIALDGVGRNSPFAAALVSRIKTPEKSLPAILIQVRNDVMKATGKRQVPWEHSALTSEVFLVPPGRADKAATVDSAKNSSGQIKATEHTAGADAAQEKPGGAPDGVCPTDDALAPFEKDFKTLRNAYDASLIDSTEFNERRSKLVAQVVPKITQGPQDESCIMQMNKLVRKMYDKSWIYSDDYNRLRKELSNQLFGPGTK